MSEDIKTFDDWVNSILALLPNGQSVLPPEASSRASIMLRAKASLAKIRRDEKDQSIKLDSFKDIAYKEAYTKAEAKNATQAKAIAEATVEFIQAREAFEVAENHIDYYDTLMQIMENGHILLRQMAKED